MRTRPRYITVIEAETGMKLGAPATVINQGKLFSLPAGHKLTDDNLLQLAAHRVEFIFVTEPDPRPDGQVAVDAAKAAHRVMEIFAGADLNDPIVATLFNQVIIYRSA
jgi:hypothetical protein